MLSITLEIVLIFELIETESRMVVSGGWEVGKMGRCWSKVTNFQL